jgi:hypothetical protein
VPTRALPAPRCASVPGDRPAGGPRRGRDPLLAIQRDGSLAAFSHIFPPERERDPDDAIREAWREALADGDVEVHVAEVDGEPVGSASVAGLSADAVRASAALGQRGRVGAARPRARAAARAAACGRAALDARGEQGREALREPGLDAEWRARVVPFPPNPIDVGFSIELHSDGADADTAGV